MFWVKREKVVDEIKLCQSLRSTSFTAATRNCAKKKKKKRGRRMQVAGDGAIEQRI
jgi:hypothetical protein